MNIPNDASLPSNFRFFGLDATGRIGSDAMAIIDHLCGTNTANYIPNQYTRDARKRFYMRMSVICARAHAQAVLMWNSCQVVGTIRNSDDYPLADFDPTIDQ